MYSTNKAVKKFFRQSEHSLQAHVFKWAALQTNVYPELCLLYAIPNGGYRTIGTAMRLKAEGVKSGVPDMCLPVARWGFNALYIEMKAKGGSLSDNQKVWIKNLTSYGCVVEVCHSAEEAIEAIRHYLKKGTPK